MEAVGNRIEWLDVAKGIGIFFVTFAHLCPNFPNFPNFQIETHIYSFHMFFFFLLSGFLYKHPDNPNEFTKKRVKSLLAPFLFWNVVGAVIVCSYGNYLNCLIAGISGIALYIMLSQLISAKPKLKLASRLFSYLGKNTVPIMCMQYLFFGTYNLICMDLLGHNESIGSMRSTIKAFALSVITIFMILMIAQIIKKIKLKPLMTVFGVKDSNENAS